jgi:hypothetical protein
MKLQQCLNYLHVSVIKSVSSVQKNKISKKCFVTGVCVIYGHHSKSQLLFASVNDAIIVIIHNAG